MTDTRTTFLAALARQPGGVSNMATVQRLAKENAALRAQGAALVQLVEELAVDPGRSDQWPGTYENWRYFDNQRKLAVRRLREILG